MKKNHSSKTGRSFKGFDRADKVIVGDPTKFNEVEIDIEKDPAAIVIITLKKGVKRSWRAVRDILATSQYKVDLRKASKTYVPVMIQCNCKYKTLLEIRRVKDFPLKNKKCRCGRYIVKWEEKK